jgi:translation initiation factor 6
MEIKDNIPDDVVVKKIDERLSALGNCIVCNDSVALLHPDIDTSTEETIADVLGVETFKTTIADNVCVGSYCVISNVGGLVHPMVSVDEMDELSALLQIPLCAGTVNRGSDVIGSGLMANDTIAFTGMDTTSTEITVIDTIFGLNECGKDEYGGGIRVDMIESLL